MYNIGVDLGGTTFTVGIVNEKGEVVNSRNKNTQYEKGFSFLIEDISNTIKEVIKESNISVNAVGIGFPGSVNSKNCFIENMPNLFIKNADVKKEMEKYIDLPLFIGNDADVAALGEYYCGNGTGYSNLIIITLGTGVGGGIIIDNKLFTGSSGRGTEIGHMVIKKDGCECNCGRKGCFEQYASATALIRQGAEIAKKNPQSLLNSKKIDGKTIFDAMDKGDKCAKTVVDEYLENLSEGLANLINIFQPEIILLGGGISNQGDRIINPIVKSLKEKVFDKKLRTKIDIVKNVDNAGVIGSAMLCKYNMENRYV